MAQMSERDRKAWLEAGVLMKRIEQEGREAKKKRRDERWQEIANWRGRLAIQAQMCGGIRPLFDIPSLAKPNDPQDLQDAFDAFDLMAEDGELIRS